MRKWGGGAGPFVGEGIGEGGGRRRRLFSPVDFFVAGVSVTHPVHLTRLLIPNIVWCGVNFLLFSATSFSLVEDPDKKVAHSQRTIRSQRTQIHFCAVDCRLSTIMDATLGHVGRVVETAGVAALL